MAKIAGASLIGFCAVSLGADKVNLNPMASQIAGFIGAFAGSIVAQRRRRVETKEGSQKSESTHREE